MTAIMRFATLLAIVFLLLGASGAPTRAFAAIDMSGTYVAIGYDCHHTFVQTGTDLQVSGGCGANPLSLTGTIDPNTGQFSVSGTLAGSCGTLGLTGTGDGEQFTATFTCSSGASGLITGSKCLNGILDAGEDCQDGNLADGDCCSSRCRFEPAGSTCGTDQNACTDDVCDGAGTCLHQANTAACDDGNACTTGDVCDGGTCVPGPPITGRACALRHACERAAARVVSSCIARVGARSRACYLSTGAACSPDDPGIVKALSKVAERIGARCPNAASVQDTGYGAAATPAGLIARVQEACTGEVASIAARTFGGPQGALLPGADSGTARCLSNANSTAVKLVNLEGRLRAACVAEEHGGAKPCDVAAIEARIAAEESDAAGVVDASCADLEATIGLDAATYVARAASQARCITAATHGHTNPLDLDCGPRNSVQVPQRGIWAHVVLDEATFGSRCGDGTPYAFWLRLAPAGSPPEKVVVNMQGGGACYFATDCAGQPAGLFNAMEPFWDDPPTAGILSASAAENPFSDWTMVYLPYCTQDAHIGGGATEVFPSLTVHRFGAINVRAALRYVRDVLWGELGRVESAGYRPDRLTVLFAGMSAGGSGVRYNYHYLLDDLRWAHTTAVPDSDLGLDSGAYTLIAPIVQANWHTRAYQPPYCLDASCAIGAVGSAATAPRLKSVPEQQILYLANQVDTLEATSGFFPSTVDWINAVRTNYCATRGLNGIHYWLPAESTPLHVFLDEADLAPTLTAGGQNLGTFLTGAMSDPDSLTDHVDEGALVTDYPGVNPIPCLP